MVLKESADDWVSANVLGVAEEEFQKLEIQNAYNTLTSTVHT